LVNNAREKRDDAVKALHGPKVSTQKDYLLPRHSQSLFGITYRLDDSYTVRDHVHVTEGRNGSGNALPLILLMDDNGICGVTDISHHQLLVLGERLVDAV